MPLIAPRPPIQEQRAAALTGIDDIPVVGEQIKAAELMLPGLDGGAHVWVIDEHINQMGAIGAKA